MYIDCIFLQLEENIWYKWAIHMCMYVAGHKAAIPWYCLPPGDEYLSDGCPDLSTSLDPGLAAPADEGQTLQVVVVK